jgi:hypothetical protein
MGDDQFGGSERTVRAARWSRDPSEGTKAEKTFADAVSQLPGRARSQQIDQAIAKAVNEDIFTDEINA